MKHFLFLKFLPCFFVSTFGQGTLRGLQEDVRSNVVVDDDEARTENLEEGHPTLKACVSLLVYGDIECTGAPVRRMVFPTETEPGSPCYHDATMTGYAVKDQYCDMTTGIWHETVFPSSLTCESHWYDFWNSVPLEFRQGECVGGFELEKCTKYQCPVQGESKSYPVVEDLTKTDHEEDSSFVPIIQNGVMIGKMKLA